MKKFIVIGLILSFSAFAVEREYAPNDGTARPGNPGAKVTDIDQKTLINDETKVDSDENLERANTSPNPISRDTTLEGKVETKQSEEAIKEDLDYRIIAPVNHSNRKHPKKNQ